MAAWTATTTRPPVTARGAGRYIEAHHHGGEPGYWAYTITVPHLTWWLMPRSRRDGGRPRQVTIPAGAIDKFKLTPPRWWTLGHGTLKIDAPGYNDPWQRRTKKQKANHTLPPPRPHRIRNTHRRQPGITHIAWLIATQP